MSSVQIYNSTPNVVLTGIQDLSGRVLTPEAERLPQHLPLFFVFSPKGNPDEVHVVGKQSFAEMYGEGFLDYSSKYATHASPFVEGLLNLNNLVMVQRLKPEGAKTAWIRFSLGITKSKLVDKRRATRLELLEKDELVAKNKTSYLDKDRTTTILEDVDGYSLKAGWIFDDKGNVSIPRDVDEGYSLRWIVGTPDEKGLETLNGLDETTRDVLERHFSFGGGLSYDQLGSLIELKGGHNPQNPLAQGIATVYGNTKTISVLSGELVYPMFDFQVTDFGSYGNNVGIRLSCPNYTSTNPHDTRFFDNYLVRAYRASIVTRKDKRSASKVVRSVYGEDFVDFVLKPHTLNKIGDGSDMYLGTRFLDQYRVLDYNDGRLPKYGPFNAVKVYDDNLKHVHEFLHDEEFYAETNAGEKTFISESAFRDKFLKNGTKVQEEYPTKGLVNGRRIIVPDEVDSEELQENKYWQLDIFTGLSINGHKYRTFKVTDNYTSNRENEVAVLRATLTESTEHFCSGGDDGKMGIHAYNMLVSEKIDEMVDEFSPWNDLARYPFSVFYDVGYPNYVKEKLPELIRFRKDISISVATHQVQDDEFAENPRYATNTRIAKITEGVTPLSKEKEVGQVRALFTMLTKYPESEVYGTKACRANIMMQCGNIIDSEYKGLVPTTYELAMKRAAFMGNINGAYNAGFGYDQDGIKQLRYMKGLNNTFIPYVMRERNWTHGATWAQFYDRRTMFFPAVRTVYRDETSVLLSDINMLIATDLEKVCFRTWRRLVGDTKLTKGVFIERSDQIIREETEGKYDGRVRIVPETYYTEADELRGYSWNCKVHMYANNMKTVGVMTVVTHRLEDLER